MELLIGSVRTYAWGSRTHLAELLGTEVPSPHPQAELWLGAHRNDPSRLAERTPSSAAPDDPVPTLIDALDTDPLGGFGPVRATRWGGRLPFLLKVLAADEPLSLQAHPSAAQAEAGYAREEAAGIPRTAAERNYPDPLPKPELLCALTEFHALAGFRDATVTLRLLRALDAPALATYTEILAAQPDSDGLRALFTTWITLPQRTVDTLVPALLDACVPHARDHGEFAAETRTLLDLGERYPGDAGVLAATLLNRVELAPGECLSQPAGSPHAYLAGAGVELMANSDNVLRAGLTPKYVDVPELLRVLDFSCGPPATVDPVGVPPVTTYAGPSDHFRLVRAAFDPGAGETDEVPLPVTGPRIVACLSGAVELRTERGQHRVLARGQAAWVPACDGTVRIGRDRSTDSSALAFVASDGLDVDPGERGRGSGGLDDGVLGVGRA